MKHPWLEEPLDEWAIVGMNHYFIGGDKRLFVAMVKDGRCIKAEGPDDDHLWQQLLQKAKDVSAKARRAPHKKG